MEEGGGEQKNMEETLFLILPSLPPFIPIFALFFFSRLTPAETLATQACKNARKK